MMFEKDLAEIICGDALTVLKTLPDAFVQCCVTSPPYWGLRDYGIEGQIGLEKTPEEYVQKLVDIFHEVRRVLNDDGTLWLNLGDSYSDGGRGSYGSSSTKQKTNMGSLLPPKKCPPGLKHKDLVGIPWMVAFALRADGWYLRQDLIWAKPNPMPESVTDRCTKSHEYLFLLSKSQKYYYDNEAIKEQATCEPHKPGNNKDGEGNLRNDFGTKSMEKVWGADGKRNKHSVWTVTTNPYDEAHFATYPPKLIDPCVLAGSKNGDIILDPFSGSGTTGKVALEKGRKYIGIELNPKYVNLHNNRISQMGLQLV